MIIFSGFLAGALSAIALANALSKDWGRFSLNIFLVFVNLAIAIEKSGGF